MAKNMTRKGLAIGASVALAAAGVVGISSPAMADSNIYLVPAVGGAEQNRVPIEVDFTLKTYYGVNANGLVAPVSVQVTDPDSNLNDVVLAAPNTGSVGAQPTFDSDEGAWLGGSLTGTTAGVGEFQTVNLIPKSVTTDSETFSVIVTSWFDDGDGVVEAGENQASQEIFFHVDDDYDWVIDFTKPELGDTAFEATVSTTVPSINLAQFAENWGLGFATIDGSNDLTKQTSDSSITASSKRLGGGTAASDDTAKYDNDPSAPTSDAADFVDFNSDGTVDFKVAVDNSGDKVTAATYIAAVVLNTTDTATAAGGAAISVTNGDEVKRVAALVSATDLDSDGVSAPTLVASADTNVASGLIRTGANSVTVETQLYTTNDLSDDSNDVKAKDGIVGTVSIAINGTFDTDSSLTAGGETLEEGDTDPIEFTVTSDEDGVLSFDIDTSNLADSDSFDVTVVAEDVSNLDAANSASTGAVTFAVNDTAPEFLVEHNLLGSGAVWKVEDGSYTLLFAAVDNFNQPLAGAGYQVVLDNGLAKDGQVSALSNGVASFSVSTENSDGDDVTSFTAQLQQLVGAAYEDVTDVADSVVANLGASNPAAKVTVSATKPGGSLETAAEATDFQLPIAVTGNADSFDLVLEEFADANTRLGGINDVIIEGKTTDGTTLSGNIVDASGIATYGSVTIAGEGLMFKAAGPTGTESGASARDVYSTDSITVQTSLLGAYSVDVFSNTAGKVDVTVSSGNASQTVTLVFDSAANTTGTAVDIAAPSAVDPGSTLQATITLTDKYGNPVAATDGTDVTLKVNYDGPGFLVGAPATMETDADGQITLTAFLGNNDGGKTATVTVSYSPDGTSETAFDGDNDIVVQQTINIGNVPSPSTGGEFNAWTKLIDNDTAVKFYAKNPSNQGKIQFFFNGEEIAWHRGTSATSYEGGEPRYNVDQDAYYLVRDVELVSGMKNVFEIEQDGERIWRAVKTLD